MARARGRTTVPSSRTAGGNIRAITAALARTQANAAAAADFVIASAMAPSAVGTKIVRIQHDLGVTPDSFFVSPRWQVATGEVWATDADRAVWTDSQIQVQTNLTSTKIEVILVKKRG